MTKRHSGLNGARQEIAALVSRVSTQQGPSAAPRQVQKLPIVSPTPTPTRTVVAHTKGKMPAGLANYLANKKKV